MLFHLRPQVAMAGYCQLICLRESRLEPVAQPLSIPLLPTPKAAADAKVTRTLVKIHLQATHLILFLDVGTETCKYQCKSPINRLEPRAR